MSAAFACPMDNPSDAEALAWRGVWRRVGDRGRHAPAPTRLRNKLSYIVLGLALLNSCTSAQPTLISVPIGRL